MTRWPWWNQLKQGLRHFQNPGIQSIDERGNGFLLLIAIDIERRGLAITTLTENPHPEHPILPGTFTLVASRAP